MSCFETISIFKTLKIFTILSYSIVNHPPTVINFTRAMFDQREACCSPWILFLSLPFPDSLYAVYVFWFKHVIWLLFSAEMMWDVMLKLQSLIFNFIADNMCACCFFFVSTKNIFFGEVIKSYLLWLFFFTYTSTDTHYLSSKFLRPVVSLGLLDSRFYGMWDVASLGAGVCAGKERVGCTIDSSCDLSDFDFQERVILILYVSVYVDSILSAYFHEIQIKVYMSDQLSKRPFDKYSPAQIQLLKVNWGRQQTLKDDYVIRSNIFSVCVWEKFGSIWFGALCSTCAPLPIHNSPGWDYCMRAGPHPLSVPAMAKDLIPLAKYIIFSLLNVCVNAPRTVQNGSWG